MSVYALNVHGILHLIIIFIILPTVLLGLWKQYGPLMVTSHLVLGALPTTSCGGISILFQYFLDYISEVNTALLPVHLFDKCRKPF